MDVMDVYQSCYHHGIIVKEFYSFQALICEDKTWFLYFHLLGRLKMENIHLNMDDLNPPSKGLSGSIPGPIERRSSFNHGDLLHVFLSIIPWRSLVIFPYKLKEQTSLGEFFNFLLQPLAMICVVTMIFVEPAIFGHVPFPLRRWSLHLFMCRELELVHLRIHLSYWSS